MTAKKYPTRSQIHAELPMLRIGTYRRGMQQPTDDEGKGLGCGTYFWFGNPGRMPESDFYGPYKTELAAIRAAYDMFGDA